MVCLLRPVYTPSMRAPRSAQSCLFIVGIWLALAPAIVAMPAATASPMSMADRVGDDGDGRCPDMDKDRASCAFTCLGAAYFVAAPEPVKLTAIPRDGIWLGHVPVLAGRQATPEPGPPRRAFS
jgi:hypothetical protein